MSRAWVWLQLTAAWLPMWALFAALIMIVHRVPFESAAVGAFRLVAPGALLGYGVYRFASRTPWPHPFRLSFLGVHIAAAMVYTVVWYIIVCLVDSAIIGRLAFAIGPGLQQFMIAGLWLYIVVACVAYTNLGAQRTAKLETLAARTQLDALRAQLHPHFLFNALHTVVQLIPIEPRRAAAAAEQLAAALRTTIEEQRDLIGLNEEWTFVEKYLAIERLRFGDRLRIETSIAAEAATLLVPSFSLQTLVENAIRHAAAPRIAATILRIEAYVEKDRLIVAVIDDGPGIDADAIERSSGTGLRRLRERLRWLYGSRADLRISNRETGGVVAVLQLPRFSDADDRTIE